MPKTTIFLGILLCCILSAGQTFALSDAEYNSLAKNSSEFRQADKELNKFWKDTIGQLDGDYKKQVLNEQRQWVKTGWDKTAQKFMAQGLSKSAAYTKAIHERINQLRVIQENSTLSENEMGSAKADDYYNASENTEPEKTGKKTDYLMEQNLKNQQELLAARKIVESTNAKRKTYNEGIAFPILTASSEEYSKFDKKLAQELILIGKMQKMDNPEAVLRIFEKAFKNLGYSFESTCGLLFEDISPKQYFRLSGAQGLDICIPIIQFIAKKDLLKNALLQGYISEEMANAYIDSSLRYYKALEQVDNDGVRLPD